MGSDPETLMRWLSGPRAVSPVSARSILLLWLRRRIGQPCSQTMATALGKRIPVRRTSCGAFRSSDLILGFVQRLENILRHLLESGRAIT